MKPTLPLLLLALAAVLPTFAADPVSAPSAPPAPARAERLAKIQEVIAQLNLTEEQKAKIAPIVQQQVADLGALRDDAKAERRERLRVAREINQKAAAQIRPLLNPEQQKKYDELRAAARAEMKHKVKERRAAGGQDRAQ